MVKSESNVITYGLLSVDDGRHRKKGCWVLHVSASMRLRMSDSEVEGRSVYI